MIKVFEFLARRPQLDHESFVRAWADEHAPVATAALGGRLRGYVQNRAVLEPGIPVFPVASFDGVEELWFDNREDAAAALVDPVYARELRPSLERIADPAVSILVAAEEAVQFDHGWGGIKFIGLSQRHPGMSHEEWCRYWIEVHGPLAYAVPEFARYYGKYVHNYLLQEPLGPVAPRSDFDGIVEEWLESTEAFARCLQEPGYLAVIQPDEQRFVDVAGSRFVIAEEHVVVS
jgi:uncharacterized protein (TIGR02118 family)